MILSQIVYTDRNWMDTKKREEATKSGPFLAVDNEIGHTIILVVDLGRRSDM